MNGSRYAIAPLVIAVNVFNCLTMQRYGLFFIPPNESPTFFVRTS